MGVGIVNTPGAGFVVLKKQMKEMVDGLSADGVGASPVGHKHTKSEITDFPASMPASDVYDWAKAATKPKYTASEVEARPSTWTPTASDVGAVPVTRKINGKALSGDITLTADDLGVLGFDTTVAAAEKLKTARNIQVNLSSSSSASFDGSKDVTPGVTGALPVSNGGTGVTSLIGEDYTTYRPRQTALMPSVPSSLSNGQIALVYV